jgi:phage terminase large subunit
VAELTPIIELNKQQGEAFKILSHENTVKYILFGGAAGGGKTFLSCFWLIRYCSDLRYPNTRWFIGRE